MTKIKCAGHLQNHEKEFLKLFNTLTYSRSVWQVWEDLMTVMACSISNTVDRTPEKFERREEQYKRAIKNLGGVDVSAQILGIITMALEENPDQDFLGKLYMSLNLGSHWRGQFFTPYNLCYMISEMNFGDGVKAEVEQKGYISICDPCVGAGAMLIAAANAMRRKEINYQTNAVFVGQDIDRVVAMMAYIQLSLIGCPGYIIIGDSLLHPPTGHVLFPQETEYQEIWYMPMFHSKVWTMRRILQTFSFITGTRTTQKTAEKEQFTYFFNFEQEELACMNKVAYFTNNPENGRVVEVKVSRNEAMAVMEAQEQSAEEGDNIADEKMVTNPAEAEGNSETGEAPAQGANEVQKKPTAVYAGIDGVEAKLKAELEKAKQKEFAEPIIKYLLKRCRESESLVADICQSHKTWNKCCEYIFDQARKKLSDKSGHICDNVVYEWAEDYYHLDDKVLEEKKFRKETEDKAKRMKTATDRKNNKNIGAGKTEKVPASKKAEIPKETSKSKRNGEDMDGQLNMFSMLGI